MATSKGLTAERVIDALKKTNGNMSLAARQLGVSRQAIKHYVDTYPTVKAAHDEAADAVTDVAEGHLVSGVMRGDWDRVKYWLETKARSRGYGRIERHEHTGKDGAPIEIRGFDAGAALAPLAPRPVGDSDEPGAD